MDDYVCPVCGSENTDENECLDCGYDFSEE